MSLSSNEGQTPGAGGGGAHAAGPRDQRPQHSVDAQLGAQFGLATLGQPHDAPRLPLQ